MCVYSCFCICFFLLLCPILRPARTNYLNFGKLPGKHTRDFFPCVLLTFHDSCIKNIYTHAWYVLYTIWREGKQQILVLSDFFSLLTHVLWYTERKLTHMGSGSVSDETKKKRMCCCPFVVRNHHPKFVEWNLCIHSKKKCFPTYAPTKLEKGGKKHFLIFYLYSKYLQTSNSTEKEKKYYKRESNSAVMWHNKKMFVSCLVHRWLSLYIFFLSFPHHKLNWLLFYPRILFNCPQIKRDPVNPELCTNQQNCLCFQKNPKQELVFIHVRAWLLALPPKSEKNGRCCCCFLLNFFFPRQGVISLYTCIHSVTHNKCRRKQRTWWWWRAPIFLGNFPTFLFSSERRKRKNATQSQLIGFWVVFLMKKNKKNEELLKGGEKWVKLYCAVCKCKVYFFKGHFNCGNRATFTIQSIFYENASSHAHTRSKKCSYVSLSIP